MTEGFYTKRILALPPALSAVLPKPLCEALSECGAPAAEEIRLYRGRFAEVIAAKRSYPTKLSLDEEEMQEILKRMCDRSLYAHRDSICAGYISLAGGIRVGVCGQAATENGRIIGVHHVSGLVIRIPHGGIAAPVASLLERLQTEHSGILIYAPPGVGKTTLLRSLAGQAASHAYGLHTVVVDTRGELAYGLVGKHLSLNILSGYPRGIGIEIAVCSLGAELLICDEIGDASDADAILASANRGVPLVASAHARGCRELLLRPPLARLHAARVFGCYVGLQRGIDNRFSFAVTSWEEAETLLMGKEGMECLSSS